MENRPEDGHNVPYLNDLYRLQYIDRWHIVRTERRQSVADHSLMVTLITTTLLGYMGVTDSKKLLKAINYATVHDALECYTGDIPSPVKKFTDNATMENLLPRFETPDMFTQDIVKMADLMDSCKWIGTWGDNGHGRLVLEKLSDEMWEHWGNVVETYGEDSYNWDEAEDLIHRFIAGKGETFIDDYI